MIKPTVGRMVWFYKHNSVSGHDGPLAAQVCAVHGDRCVNLMVISKSGVPFSESSVLLVQDGDPIPTGSSYCCWMPYQLGQAAKTEAAEKQARATTGQPVASER